MHGRAIEILTELAELPESEQFAVAEAVVLGPEETDPVAWEAAWLAEVHRRRSAGCDDAVPLETFGARIRSRWPAA